MAQDYASGTLKLGYNYGGTVYYTSSGTFSKGNYPGLRAIRVKVVGGGGGGGGAATTQSANIRSVGHGGGGGAYAESFILVSDLDTTEAVTVGAGGSGNSGANGSDGADSVFDTISSEVRADGGGGGTVSTSTATLKYNDLSNGGTAGGSVGDLRAPGGGGFGAYIGDHCRGGAGGGSHFCPRGPGASNGNNLDGTSATGFVGCGGGGGNNINNQPTARTGGDGADGIVIVELYY